MLKDIPEKWEIDLSRPKTEEEAETILADNQIKFC